MSEDAPEQVDDERSRRGPIAAVGWVLVALAAGFFFFVWGAGEPATSVPRPIADVSSERLLDLGNVVGFAAAYDTNAWLGLPYARPPMGPLRWRAPEPPEPWVDTLDALAVGSPCAQYSSLLGGVPSEAADGFVGDEDCLTLNVWAPHSTTDGAQDREPPEKLPVLVWIHGGGNTRGFAGSPMYDGARLAGEQQVVVVGINYRLGPFGWFSHPALRAEAKDAVEASGNFGTLDQIQALEWVQTNIGEFGGDPDNVTIFGESAGGRNVFALLLAPSARGLFHRAIAQSGGTDSVSRAEAEAPFGSDTEGHPHSSAEVVVSLLEQAGVVPDRAAARGYAESFAPADLVEFLRARSAREVLASYRDEERGNHVSVPTVIGDGVLLPEGDWLEVLREGRFHRVPVMLGSNRDEMKVFLSQNDDWVSQHFGLWYRIRDLPSYEARARAHSDLWAVRAVAEPAAAMAAAGAENVFTYRFDWDEWPNVLGQDMAQLFGAGHGFELPFLFGTFDLGHARLSRLLFPEETEASRERLGKQIRGYWAEFARRGQPGRGGDGASLAWPAFGGGGDSGAAALPAALVASDSVDEPAATPSGEPGALLILDTASDGGLRIEPSQVSRAGVLRSLAAGGVDEAGRCEGIIDVFIDGPGARGRNPNVTRPRIRGTGCESFLPEAGSGGSTLR